MCGIHGCSHDIVHQKSRRTVPVWFAHNLAQPIAVLRDKHVAGPAAKPHETCISSTSPAMLSVSTIKHKGKKMLQDKHSKLDYLQSLKKAYRSAIRPAKTSLLDIAEDTTGYNRDYINYLLRSHHNLLKPKPAVKRKRQRIYGSAVRSVVLYIHKVHARSQAGSRARWRSASRGNAGGRSRHGLGERRRGSRRQGPAARHRRRNGLARGVVGARQGRAARRDGGGRGRPRRSAARTGMRRRSLGREYNTRAVC